MRLRNMSDEVGKPYNKRMVGAVFGRLHDKRSWSRRRWHVDTWSWCVSSENLLWPPDAGAVSATFCTFLPSDVLTAKKIHYRCYTCDGNMKQRRTIHDSDWRDGFL